MLMVHVLLPLDISDDAHYSPDNPQIFGNVLEIFIFFIPEMLENNTSIL